MDAPTSSKRKRAAGADIAAQAVEEASDAEVEEFYAILRRMRDASRRYVSGTGAKAGGAEAGARAPAARAPAWCPSFSWEDFAPPPVAPAPSPSPPQPVAENVTLTPPRRPAGFCLDLNAEPEPEAPATPRPERVSA